MDNCIGCGRLMEADDFEEYDDADTVARLRNVATDCCSEIGYCTDCRPEGKHDCERPTLWRVRPWT